MKDFELDKLKKEFYPILRETWTAKKQLTPEQKQTRNKIECIDMVNSTLAYYWDDIMTAEELLDFELHHKRISYLKEYVEKLGEECVLQIIKEQINDVDHILRNVFTDSEGLSYNSIIWKK